MYAAHFLRPITRSCYIQQCRMGYLAGRAMRLYCTGISREVGIRCPRPGIRVNTTMFILKSHPGNLILYSSASSG